MKANLLLASALFVCAVPAFCDSSIVVSSPQAGATVGVPFVLAATASPCSGQTVSAMGYSLDYGATEFVYAASINASVTASTGSHTLHVKSWGNQGAACDTDVPIIVSASAPSRAIYGCNRESAEPWGRAGIAVYAAASGTQCESQPIVAFGFSIDDSSQTTIVRWVLRSMPRYPRRLALIRCASSHGGIRERAAMTDIAINVVPSPVSQLPSNAIAVQSIQTLTGWEAAIRYGNRRGCFVLRSYQV